MSNFELIDTGDISKNTIDMVKELHDFSLSLDDKSISAEIKGFLQTVAKPLSFLVVGEVNSGKSSFVNALCCEEVCEVSIVPNTRKIFEIRHGIENTVFDVNDVYTKVFISNPAIRNISIYDTPGIGSHFKNFDGVLASEIPKMDIIFTIVPADKPLNSEYWDFITDIKSKWNKTMIFILSKVDTLKSEELNSRKSQLREKVLSLGVDKPTVFSFSKNGNVDKSDSSISPVQEYLFSNVVSEGYFANKNESVINSVAGYYRKISSTFENRLKQYKADLGIVESINTLIDDFRSEHDQNVEKLMQRLSIVIDTEIDDYKDEMLKRLDPDTITERFKTKADFEKWLMIHNDFYKERMTNEVERTTQQSIKKYMWQMEKLLESASEYIEDRPQYLSFEDSLYGSLAKAQSNVVQKTTLSVQHLSVSNRNLYDASEELFMQVWEARKRSDLYGRVAGGTGAVGGLASGAVIGGIVGGILEVSSVAAIAAMAPLMPYLLGIGIAILGYELAKVASEDLIKDNLHKETNKAVEKFSCEIENLKANMKDQIGLLLNETFDLELKMIEKLFSELRITTYTEDENIKKMLNALSLIEEKLDIVGGGNYVAIN